MLFLFAFKKGFKMVKNKLYDELITKLNDAKANHQPVLLEDDTTGMIDTRLLDIAYVGERWATGYETVYNGEDEYKVPYTINYGSLYTVSNSGDHKVKLIFQGENNFV